MTSDGAMGRGARVVMALRIIRWNPRRASTSDSGGWSAGGGMERKGGGSRRRRAGKLKEFPGTLIEICTRTGFNKERAITQVEGGGSV